VKLARLLELGRTIRVVGFDDAPFARTRGASVPIAGIVCADTRIEGMLWGRARRDGWNATDVISAMLDGSKFRDQVRVVLLDGVAVGGFNVIDLPTLHTRTGMPCLTVMRRAPDLEAMRRVIERLPDPPRRLALLARAGEIHQRGPFTYQVVGEDPDVGEKLLQRFTREGNVPECLRLAHLIGSAVMLGESGRRA
jgi:uncharacterized protein